jgi:cation-transporting ATPase E
VTHVGDENYAAKLANEVKREKRVQSELLGSMRKVIHFTSSLIIPLGILLFMEAFILRHTPVNEAVH